MWAGLWLTQSDARYLCGHRHKAISLCNDILPYLPSEKKILCPFHLRSGYDFHFPILSKQKSRYTTSRITRGFPPVLIPQCYVTALKFKTHAAIHQPKKQRCFGGGQPCPSADIQYFNLCVI